MVGFILLRAEDSSVSLQELFAEKNQGMQLPLNLAELSQSARNGTPRPLDFDMQSLFYALLGLCGILLSVRTLIYIARVCRSEHLSLVQGSAGYIAPGERAVPLAPAISVALDGVSTESVAPSRRPMEIRSASHPWSRILFCGYGLTGRMIFTFTTIIAMFGLLTMATVYFALTASLRTQVIERARVAAVNVSDSAAGFLLKKNFIGLRELLGKFADRKGTAYVLVENSRGEILAHISSAQSSEIRVPDQSHALASADQHRLWAEQGAIDEVTAPILEGQIGSVRLGIWRDAVDSEIFRTVMPLMKVIALVIAGGIVLAIVLAWKIIRPIIKLVDAARSISRGDLDAPSLGLEDPTEFGELSRALERMRSSVKAAMTRLSQEQRTYRSSNSG
jgi:HAMP domain-containing protein